MQPSLKRFRPQGLLVVLLMCRAAFGQVGSGDYDADYDVDGDDFANWAACMTGEDTGYVDPWSQCAAFDFDEDQDVDLEDFGAFQLAFLTPPDPYCAPAPGGPGGRYFVGATKFVTAPPEPNNPDTAKVIGSSAKITAHPVDLCDEPFSNKEAHSVVYTGVTKWITYWGTNENGQPVLLSKPSTWVQIGYGRIRAAGGPWVAGVYVESRLVDGSYLLAMHDVNHPNVTAPFNGVVPVGNTQYPTATHTYACFKLNKAHSKWYFHLDTSLLHSLSHELFIGMAGHAADAKGELRNLQDDLVGIEATKCSLSELGYKDDTGVHPFNLQDDYRPDGDLEPLPPGTPPNQWGVTVVGPLELKIWDKIPN